MSPVPASASVCIHFHFSVLMYTHFSLTVPFTASDCRCFHSFLFLTLPLFGCLFLLHLFLLLSVSICLSGQVGFHWGLHPDTVTGVSLFLRWWRHFAVRITTADIDGKETQDFRGHREQAGGGSFKVTHTTVVGTGAHRSLRLTQSIKGKPLFIISLLHLATLYISVLL